MPGPPYRGLRIILGIFSLPAHHGQGNAGHATALFELLDLRDCLRELMLLSGLQSPAH